MMIEVSITKAKAILCELVARVEAGDEVVLTRYGKAVVTLRPVKPVRPETPNA